MFAWGPGLRGAVAGAGLTALLRSRLGFFARVGFLKRRGHGMRSKKKEPTRGKVGPEIEDLTEWRKACGRTGHDITQPLYSDTPCRSIITRPTHDPPGVTDHAILGVAFEE